MKKPVLIFSALLLLAWPLAAQVPLATGVQILKAEDARRYDDTLRKLLASPNAAVRKRAALAAGRIGDDKAVIDLSPMLADSSTDVRVMAAFALGEIESIKAAGAIEDAITRVSPSRTGAGEPKLFARLVEAAGKIAAANPKDPEAKKLGESIIYALKTQPTDRENAVLVLTAALRARPEGADKLIAAYLESPDARIRGDAANALARIRAKSANPALRKMLASDADAVARSRAAAALGAADDKDAFDLLLKAATEDADSRVRVSAISSLGSLKDARATGPLMERAEKLLSAARQSKLRNPVERNELLGIASVLGRILANSADVRAVKLFDDLIAMDHGVSPEFMVGRLLIAPGNFSDGSGKSPEDWRQWTNHARLLGEFATIDAKTDEAKKIKAEAPGLASLMSYAFAIDPPADKKKFTMAGPEFLRAFARFKTPDLAKVLKDALLVDDLFVRATAAGLLANVPKSPENVEALKKAFDYALVHDKTYNDAQLATLDALYKLDKREAVGALLVALSATDYLVRKKAFELLADKDLQRDFPGIATSLELAWLKHKDQVLPYSLAFGTKLGQVLNTDADYTRALARKDGSVRAVVQTEKGAFTIEFLPEEAPLTVDNFVKLARAGYFNGLEVHRVVPNFVMQDGDPRGDGDGGPGWSIRCEINMVPYERGAVGMALSGKDTGGSQWFVTHSPQPHLDGGYTVFGKVNESGMKVVDTIVRGDRILSIKVIGR